MPDSPICRRQVRVASGTVCVNPRGFANNLRIDNRAGRPLIRSARGPVTALSTGYQLLIAHLDRDGMELTVGPGVTRHISQQIVFARVRESALEAGENIVAVMKRRAAAGRCEF